MTRMRLYNPSLWLSSCGKHLGSSTGFSFWSAAHPTLCSVLMFSSVCLGLASFSTGKAGFRRVERFRKNETTNSFSPLEKSQRGIHQILLLVCKNAEHVAFIKRRIFGRRLSGQRSTRGNLALNGKDETPTHRLEMPSLYPCTNIECPHFVSLHALNFLRMNMNVPWRFQITKFHA
jgi:hypothetical protein